MKRSLKYRKLLALMRITDFWDFDEQDKLIDIQIKMFEQIKYGTYCWMFIDEYLESLKIGN